MKMLGGVTFVALSLAAGANAQGPSPDFASQRHPPERSAEIVLGHDLSTPEGTYPIVRAEHGFWDPGIEYVYTVFDCVPLSDAETRRLRSETGARQFLRCDVIETGRVLEPGQDPTGPRMPGETPVGPRSWEGVVFGRHTAGVLGDDGRPVFDNWFADVVVGGRHLRLFISDTRFVWQESWATTPEIRIVEAPIRRPAE